MISILLSLALVSPTFTSTEPPQQGTRTLQQEIAAVVSQRPVHQAFDWFRANEPRLRDFQSELTAIPAPPFQEQKRGEWLAARFRELGLKVEIDKVGNVIAERPGTDPSANYIALVAHIDTVFPPEAPIKVIRDGERLIGPGIGDNAAGVTAIYALAAALQKSDLRHAAGILFIGNVGEEGEGDLRGVRYLFSESPWKERIGYTIAVDGSGHQRLTTQGTGSRRFEVIVRGPGGHSWGDFGLPNPIVALSRALVRFSETNVPADPRTTINAGVVTGGTSVNSIPEYAAAKVDIRSAATEQVALLEAALRAAVTMSLDVENTRATRPGKLQAEIRIIGDRPAGELRKDSRLRQVFRAVDSHFGWETREGRSSTDANIPLAEGLEAVAVGGGGASDEAHTLHEWFDPTGRELGLKRLLVAVLTLASAPAQ